MSKDDGDEYRQSQAEITEAWNQPAFSFDTIAADPWTAVYLPIPENAPRALLEHAHSWAVDLQEYVSPARHNPNAQNAFDGPFGGAFEGGSQQEFFADAGARIEALGVMIGEAALQNAAAADPAKVEQARKLLRMAGDMHSHYDVAWEDGRFAVVRTFEIEDSVRAEYGVPAEQTIYSAENIDRLIDKVLTREGWRLDRPAANENVSAGSVAEATRIRDAELEDFPDVPEVAPEQRVRGFFSVAGSLENLGGHLSRAVTTALNVVIGFFVDEPKLTCSRLQSSVLVLANSAESCSD
jgi:hypothetical protein